MEVSYVIGEEEVCAILIRTPAVIENIRVLLLADDGGKFRSAVYLKADVDASIKFGETVSDYAAGTLLDVSTWFTERDDTFSIQPATENGKIFLCDEVGNTISNGYSGSVEVRRYEEGYTVARYAFTDTNDVTSVAQTAADNSDVIYIPTDNTAASNTEAIANVVIPAKVPVVAGEEGICSGCGVATLSISYYDLGYATGEMAAKILADGADVSTMPVEFAPNVTKKYNAANCEALGITPPSDYVAIG